jgi:hypothetical protein
MQNHHRELKATNSICSYYRSVPQTIASLAGASNQASKPLFLSEYCLANVYFCTQQQPAQPFQQIHCAHSRGGTTMDSEDTTIVYFTLAFLLGQIFK